MSGKWWVILVQAILLVALSIYVFGHPGVTLLSIAYWVSVLILGAGLAGIGGSLVTREQNRKLLVCCGALAVQCLAFAAGRIGFAMQLITNL